MKNQTKIILAMVTASLLAGCSGDSSDDKKTNNTDNKITNGKVLGSDDKNTTLKGDTGKTKPGDTNSSNTQLHFKVFGNEGAFAALRSDGTVITWGGAEYGGESSSLDLTNVKTVVANNKAFSALKNDGTVLTWGRHDYGPDNFDATLSDVKAIYGTGHSFVALKNNGDLVSWGTTYLPAKVTPTPMPQNVTNVKEIYPTGEAYALLKTDGSVVSWGNISQSKVDYLLTNIETIIGFNTTYVAINKDGEALSWGKNASAGYFYNITDIKAIAASNSGLSFLKNDGTIKTVRMGGADGLKADEISQLTEITQLVSTEDAFAALHKDGTVSLWGHKESGATPYIVGNSGTPTTGEEVILTNVKALYATNSAFAALKNDNSVVTWGYTFNGANSSEVELTNIKTIYSNEKAFAALTLDATVITWGAYVYSAAQVDLTDVKDIQSNQNAFIAFKSDGTAATWGWADHGGDSSKVDLNP